MKIKLVNTKKKKVGDVDLDPSIFEVEVKPHLIRDMIVSQMANRRSGTHSTKGMHEVRGGGRKPWKQKGLGRARAGSIRSPLMRGGGITFGPKPRNYGYKIPKKARRSALISSLTVKAQEKALIVVDKISFDEPKTKNGVAALSSLGLKGKTLIVINSKDKNVSLSFRNIPRVKMLAAKSINVLDLIDAEHVLMTKDALDSITERLTK